MIFDDTSLLLLHLECRPFFSSPFLHTATRSTPLFNDALSPWYYNIADTQCIREVEFKSLHGRKVAIDASMAIYQFLIAVRSGGPNQQAMMLTNADGETTSHIQGMFNRTIRFLTEGMKPVFVFDGKAPQMKSGELEKRREKRKKAEEELNLAYVPAPWLEGMSEHNRLKAQLH